MVAVSLDDLYAQYGSKGDASAPQKPQGSLDDLYAQYGAKTQNAPQESLKGEETPPAPDLSNVDLPFPYNVGAKALAAKEGFVQGVSRGFADEATAIPKAAVRAAFSDDNFGDAYIDAYREERDANRFKSDLIQQASPKTAGAYNLAGSLMTPLKGVGKIGRVGQAFIEGTAFGAGNSEADLTRGEVGEFLSDTATNAALSGAFSAALGGGTKALKAVGNSNMVRSGLSKIPGSLGDKFNALQKVGEPEPGMIHRGISKLSGVNADKVRAFQQAGIDPTLATAGGATARNVNAALEQVPFAGGVVKRAKERTLQQMQERVNSLADDISPNTSIERAGQAAQRGAKRFVDQFRGESDALFNKVDEYIDGAARIPIQSTLSTLSGQANKLAATPNVAKRLSNPTLKGLYEDLLKDAPDGQVPYESLKAIRSSIGSKLSNYDVISDIPRAELKQIYGALSQDMKQAAAAQGDDALRAFNRANDFYKNGIRNIEDTLEKIIKSDTPEKAFKAMVTGTREGATRLRSIRKSLPADEFRVVQSQVIRDLGRATPGQQNAAGDAFSANTFLTNWNRLSHEAKNAMFSGTDKGGLRRSLDNLTKVAESVKESGKVANVSNTAGALISPAIAVGTYVSPTTLLALPAAASGARLMQNPQFVNWLAKGLQKKSQRAVASHIQQLPTVAFANPDIREDLQAYLENF